VVEVISMTASELTFLLRELAILLAAMLAIGVLMWGPRHVWAVLTGAAWIFLHPWELAAMIDLPCTCGHSIEEHPKRGPCSQCPCIA
jgi:hypothetical protein